MNSQPLDASQLSFSQGHFGLLYTMQLDPVLIFIIVQLYLHISYPTFQSVLLLLMFIEVIVVMARNDYHPRLLRVVRPFFFINSHLMYDLRR